MREAEIPVVIVSAGGYARQLVDTVDIHVATIEEALTTMAARSPSVPTPARSGLR
jgi:hypothetical protein